MPWYEEVLGGLVVTSEGRHTPGGGGVSTQPKGGGAVRSEAGGWGSRGGGGEGGEG